MFRSGKSSGFWGGRLPRHGGKEKSWGTGLAVGMEVCVLVAGWGGSWGLWGLNYNRQQTSRVSPGSGAAFGIGNRSCCFGGHELQYLQRLLYLRYARAFLFERLSSFCLFIWDMHAKNLCFNHLFSCYAILKATLVFLCGLFAV